MKLACPHCAQRINIPPEFYGTSVNCPACGGGFTVPSATESTPTPPELPTPPEVPASPELPGLDGRCAELKAHFAGRDFRVNDADNTPEFPFDFSASKVRFDLVGAPTFLEEIFIFDTIDGELTQKKFERFLDTARDWALAHGNNMPKSAELSKKAMRMVLKFGLGKAGAEAFDHLSVRETTCLIYVYAIALASHIDPDTRDWLWSKKSACARKDGMQAFFVVPIFYNPQAGEFHHFKKRPLLGNVYFTEARKVIRKNLIDP